MSGPSCHDGDIFPRARSVSPPGPRHANSLAAASPSRRQPPACPAILACPGLCLRAPGGPAPSGLLCPIRSTTSRPAVRPASRWRIVRGVPRDTCSARQDGFPAPVPLPLSRAATPHELRFPPHRRELPPSPGGIEVTGLRMVRPGVNPRGWRCRSLRVERCECVTCARSGRMHTRSSCFRIDSPPLSIRWVCEKARRCSIAA